jgi:DNA-directed RNA polymerase subunit RPC12/RpoP
MNNLVMSLAISGFIVAVPVILILRIVKRAVLVCPACAYEFKLSVNSYVRAFHTLGEREATCPVCGYHGFMKEYWEKK